MYKYLLLLIYILIILWNKDSIKAGENGSRYEGPLDMTTAEMLNVQFLPDSTEKNGNNEKHDVAEIISDSTDMYKLGEVAGFLDTFGVDTAAADTLDPFLSDISFEKDTMEEQLNSFPLAYIPEHELEKLEFERRDMTPDLVEQYPPGMFVPRTVTNNAWEVGEHLMFDLTYSFYKAGTATMSVVGKEWVNGGECYHVQTTAKSNKFISTFYKVLDRVNSFIDIKGIFSRRLEKRLREGGYKSDRYIDFYHDRLLALNTKEKYAFAEIPLYVQDILSSLYFIRTFDLDVGKAEEVQAYADGKVYTLKIIVHKREKVEVPAGIFTCLKVEPVLKSEGLFRQKGRLHVWLTDDRYKIPVKMTSKVVIGSIASKLVSYQTGVIQ